MNDPILSELARECCDNVALYPERHDLAAALVALYEADDPEPPERDKPTPAHSRFKSYSAEWAKWHARQAIRDAVTALLSERGIES